MTQILNNQPIQEDKTSITTTKKKWYKKWWGIILIVVGLYFLVSLSFLAVIGKRVSQNNLSSSLFNSEQVLEETLFLHTADDPTWGEPGAKLTIMEFSDFQCPFCQESFPVIRELLFRYQDQIHYIYRDFPDAINHPDAINAALAANCAIEQEKFWPMHDKLFLNRDKLSVTDLKRYAKELGLEESEFNGCFDSGKYHKEIQEDYQDGVNLGVIGTPTFFINGYKVSGSLPMDVFLQIAEFVLADESIE